MTVATASAPAAAVQRGRRLAIDRERGWRWLMLAPMLLLLTALTVLPLVELLVLSVSNVTWRNARPMLSLAGLANFAALIHDSLFLTSVRNTFVFVAVAVTVEITIGLALALALGTIRRGKDVYTTAFMLPILLPGIVIGAIWALMYNPDFGIINSTLQFFDLQPRDWLGSPDLALGSIMAVDVWHWTPFCFLLLYAAVELLPSDVFEAARIDGAGAWQRFRYVALPLLTPAIMVVLAFRAIIAFKVFDEVYLLTSGGPGTVTEVVSSDDLPPLFHRGQCRVRRGDVGGGVSRARRCNARGHGPDPRTCARMMPRSVRTVLPHLPLTVAAICILGPFVWIAMAAFQTQIALLTGAVLFHPNSAQLPRRAVLGYIGLSASVFR